MWVPDQLKSAVVVACRYEPGIQRIYAEFAGHYDSAVVPARPYKPRDKAKVEVAVQVVQRWILAQLRNETFFSLESLNVRIRELLDIVTRCLDSIPPSAYLGQTNGPPDQLDAGHP
jgi:transposase